MNIKQFKEDLFDDCSDNLDIDLEVINYLWDKNVIVPPPQEDEYPSDRYGLDEEIWDKCYNGQSKQVKNQMMELRNLLETIVSLVKERQKEIFDEEVKNLRRSLRGIFELF